MLMDENELPEIRFRFLDLSGNIVKQSVLEGAPAPHSIDLYERVRKEQPLYFSKDDGADSLYARIKKVVDGQWRVEIRVYESTGVQVRLYEFKYDTPPEPVSRILGDFKASS